MGQQEQKKSGGVKSKEVIKYWLSCSRFTVQVDARDGRIVTAAPIVRKFKGQPVANLVRWMGAICMYSGGVQVERLN